MVLVNTSRKKTFHKFKFLHFLISLGKQYFHYCQIAEFMQMHPNMIKRQFYHTKDAVILIFYS